MDQSSTRKDNKDRKFDKAVDMSFPASHPTSHGKPMSTEPHRKAPRITKEQIEQAQRAEGHKQRVR